MSITTTTTPARRTHTASLAGGIKADLDPAVFGHTLTLTDGEPRVLVLSVLPAALAEMAAWSGALGDVLGADGSASFWLAFDVGAFVWRARYRVSGDDLTAAATHDDIVALAGLAAAALAGGGDR